jgi:hypothetical protein
MPAGRSIYSWNMIGGEFGLRSRLGYREWATNLDGEVRTILPFTGSTAAGATSRLFACTQTGIWDVTASSAAPSQVVTFPTQGADSGYGICSAFTDASGGHWLLYCDEENGYYTYAESGAVWTKVTMGAGATQINGVDPAHLAAVIPWKNRLWFIERGTQRAWYLPLYQLYGTATAFSFGARFRAGGELRTLASWTMDAGSGPDDRLVAVSGGGDVVIYQGTDPSSADTFGIAGVWQIGAVPFGRRITTDTGGDLLLMSSLGILSLSRLVVGKPIVDRSQYETTQIANLWNQYQAVGQTLRGWSMVLHPMDAALMVLVPQATGAASLQLVMSMTTRGWHRYRGLPIGLCAAPWGNTLYFGTLDGRVCVNEGYVDGVTLADPNAYSAIDCSLLTAFGNGGSNMRKRIQQIRVKVMSQGGSIPVQAEARYGFDMSEAAVPGASAIAVGSSVWDAAIWDTSVWAGEYQPEIRVFGAWGSGQDVAVAVRMSITSRATLIGLDLVFDEGEWR